jgi:hypothetical protein
MTVQACAWLPHIHHQWTISGARPLLPLKMQTVERGFQTCPEKELGKIRWTNTAAVLRNVFIYKQQIIIISA